MLQIKPNCLLGLSGSVASIKAEELVSALQKHFTVVVIATRSALHFVDLPKLRNKCQVYTDEDEWKNWKRKGDPVQHIELRHWAALYVIAPLSANTLAKLANGLCDNLVTCVARAWDRTRPLIIAPAMNTLMWSHPLTERHLKSLADLGYVKQIAPICKFLACGDMGQGAMAEPLSIASECYRVFSVSHPSLPASTGPRKTMRPATPPSKKKDRLPKRLHPHPKD